MSMMREPEKVSAGASCHLRAVAARRLDGRVRELSAACVSSERFDRVFSIVVSIEGFIYGARITISCF